MKYRIKITFLTGGKTYRPGMVLPADISSSDLRFLKSKGFVEPAADAEETDYDEPEDESDGFSGFHEQEPDTLKTSEEIRKIRSKKEADSYAASIGLDLGDDYENRSLKQLQEEIINFQEEQADEEEE